MDVIMGYTIIHYMYMYLVHSVQCLFGNCNSISYCDAINLLLYLRSVGFYTQFLHI